ncbi:MAG: hypothetical protein VKS61_12640 [Candidatus Sericytochromatia bacterium]|nr:hypothetical protein [Candidatus Sericytochromatia bacterium]
MHPDPDAPDVSIPAAYWRLEFDVPQGQPAATAPETEASGGPATLLLGLAGLLAGVEEHLATLASAAGSSPHPLEGLLDHALQAVEVALAVAPEKLADLLGC